MRYPRICILGCLLNCHNREFTPHDAASVNRLIWIGTARMMSSLPVTEIEIDVLIAHDAILRAKFHCTWYK